eukprot:3029064-Prymnesium_polylepis.1
MHSNAQDESHRTTSAREAHGTSKEAAHYAEREGERLRMAGRFLSERGCDALAHRKKDGKDASKYVGHARQHAHAGCDANLDVVYHEPLRGPWSFAALSAARIAWNMESANRDAADVGSLRK